MGLKILIVDEEKIFGKNCVQYLQHAGHEAENVSSAVEAVASCERKKYDVILLEMNLKKISGLAFLKMLKARAPLTVVIMMSGFSTQLNAQECLATGADDFLFKPFRMAKLLQTLQPIISRQRRWLDAGIIG